MPAGDWEMKIRFGNFIGSMKRFLLVLILLSVRLTASAADAFYMPLQFMVENGNYDQSLVVLKKNGETVFTLPGEKNLRLKLEFNEDYVVAFSKPGFITKQVRVDTRVPAERLELGFDPYKIGVRIYKQYEGVNIVVYNQPVACVRFMASLDDFGYDTDYTKSILSLLMETEDALATKAEEERLALRQKPKQMTAENKSGTKEKESASVTEVRAQQEAVNTNASSENFQSPVNESGDTENIPEQSGAGSEKSLSVNIDGGSDVISKKQPDGGSDLLIHGEGARGSDPRIERSIMLEGKDDVPVDKAAILTSLIEKDEVFEPHRTITTYKVHKGDRTSVYHSVKYLNGNCFYFMNNYIAISVHLFRYFTGEKE